VIDLHCHVIPGIDDGPHTIDDSVALCEAARAAGTETIIATPHLNWHYPRVDAVVIHTALAHLNSVLATAEPGIRVRPGAEMSLARVPDLTDAEVGVLRLGAGPYVLVECPHEDDDAALIRDALRAFAERGHRIVLAHPERSPSFARHPHLLPGLLADGMLSCITARSLIGAYGTAAQNYAWELLSTGLVHAIASDAHDVTRRPPDLRPTLEDAGLEAGQIDYFVAEAPAAIIAGDSLSPPPRVAAPPARRRSHKGHLTRRWRSLAR
jgi:protein-tyrosine phosphatase